MGENDTVRHRAMFNKYIFVKKNSKGMGINLDTTVKKQSKITKNILKFTKSRSITDLKNRVLDKILEEPKGVKETKKMKTNSEVAGVTEMESTNMAELEVLESEVTCKPLDEQVVSDHVSDDEGEEKVISDLKDCDCDDTNMEEENFCNPKNEIKPESTQAAKFFNLDSKTLFRDLKHNLKVPSKSYKRRSSLDKIREIPKYLCDQSFLAFPNLLIWLTDFQTTLSQEIRQMIPMIKSLFLILSIYIGIFVIFTQLSFCLFIVFRFVSPPGLIFLCTCLLCIGCVAIRFIVLDMKTRRPKRSLL